MIKITVKLKSSQYGPLLKFLVWTRDKLYIFSFFLIGKTALLVITTFARILDFTMITIMEYKGDLLFSLTNKYVQIRIKYVQICICFLNIFLRFLKVVHIRNPFFKIAKLFFFVFSLYIFNYLRNHYFPRD